MLDLSEFQSEINKILFSEENKQILKKKWDKLSFEHKIEILKEFSLLDNSRFLEHIYSNLSAKDKKSFVLAVDNYAQLPFKAIWKNADHDIPVTVIGIMGTAKGKIFYKVAESNSGICEDELGRLL